MEFRRRKTELHLEDSVIDNELSGLEIREVPLSNKPLLYLGATAFLLAVIVASRILILNFGNSSFYRARAASNISQMNYTAAPRGIIKDRNDVILADNISAFSAILDVREFIKDNGQQEKVLATTQRVLGLDPEEVLNTMNERIARGIYDPIVLLEDLSREEAVAIKALNLSVVTIQDSFARIYPKGSAFSSVLGYVGLPSPQDLEKNPNLMSRDSVGKMGIEAFYDDVLRGIPGVDTKMRNAKGKVLEEKQKTDSKIGTALTLTVDADFEQYVHERMSQGLQSLGRTRGSAIAMNPQTGEVLALINFPAFDNNVFVAPGHSQERKDLLTSLDKPMFARATSGMYAPGSTIKPLVGIAALKEGIISPSRTIFSPGYLDIPNPYKPNVFTRYLDWRYQGDVNLAAAIAQSSDVYFYEVGGGFGSIHGLGITKLVEWWKKFNFGNPTGIDLPNEAEGFLPTPNWKEKKQGTTWLLGDSFNVSIGQGDLLVTPIQLLTYISTIANNGKMQRPFVAKINNQSQVITDLSSLLPEIREVQKGMRQAVTSQLGTAHLLNDLPFSSAAKTGSAQVQNNTKENAFFTGYAPMDNPQIAILILIEHSKEGSLNTIPIAKDVLNWYYQHRIKK